jgi:hypothetical protein
VCDLILNCLIGVLGVKAAFLFRVEESSTKENGRLDSFGPLVKCSFSEHTSKAYLRSTCLADYVQQKAGFCELPCLCTSIYGSTGTGENGRLSSTCNLERNLSRP